MFNEARLMCQSVPKIGDFGVKIGQDWAIFAISMGNHRGSRKNRDFTKKAWDICKFSFCVIRGSLYKTMRIKGS